MIQQDTFGKIHSFQSLGTVDGPGVRFVVFMQGCPLRCGCCHNPDTWDVYGGNTYTVEEVLSRVRRCRPYFGNDGGITVSGGEPLLQPQYVSALFEACHQVGIHTCLDTSGCVWNASVRELLQHTDRVLLDIKYTDDTSYREYVGCKFKTVLSFLEHLQELCIPTTIRQVILPSLNDTEDQLLRLRQLAQQYSCVDFIELLPFKKMCAAKYKALGIPFLFDRIDEPSKEYMAYLETLIRSDKYEKRL